MAVIGVTLQALSADDPIAFRGGGDAGFVAEFIALMHFVFGNELRFCSVRAVSKLNFIRRRVLTYANFDFLKPELVCKLKYNN